MRRLVVLLVLLCQSVCPLVYAQSAPEKQTSPPKQEKPAPLTPEQQDLSRLLHEGIVASQKEDAPTAEKTLQTGLEKAQTLKDEYWTAQFFYILGVVYLQMGHPEKAVDYYQRALTLHEKLGNLQGVATTLNNLGAAYSHLSQPDKALDYFRQALTLYKKLDNSEGIANNFLGQGNIYYSQAQFTKALDLYKQALLLFKKQNNPQGIASSLTGLGAMYTKLARLDKARDYFKQVLIFFEKQGNPKNIADSLHNLGAAYLDLGQLKTAQSYYQKALALREKRNSPADIASSLYSLGSVNDSLGQFDKALSYYQKALSIQEKQSNPQPTAETLNGLGIVYAKLARLDRALDYFQQALDIFKKYGNAENIANTLNNLGAIYGDLAQFEKALAYHQQALALRKQVGAPKNIATSLNNMGNVYDNLGEFKKALAYYQQALVIREKQGTSQDIASTLTNLGLVYSHLGQRKQGLAFHKRALALEEKQGNLQDITVSLNNLGRDYLELKRFDEADRSFFQAIKCYEDLRTQISDPSQLGSLQTARQGDPYLNYAAFLLERQRPAIALQYAERGRGQGLARQAQQNHTDLSALLAPADAALRQQKQDILTTASTLWQAAQNRVIPTDKQEQQALIQQQQQARQQYHRAELELTALEANLRRKYPRYRQIQGVTPPSSTQLTALARNHPGTLYVEYAIVNSQTSLLFALSHQGLKAFVLAVHDKVLQNLAEDWKHELVNNSANEADLAQKLGKILLAPLEKAGLLQENGFSHLVVVADGQLLDIPFAALMDSKGKRLIERFAVSSAFSLGSLLWPQEQQQPTGTLLCAADPTGDGSIAIRLASRGGGFRPIPAARDEVNDILPLFAGTKTVAYFGTKAQRERIQQEMGQYALLHFATHGVADGIIGLRSGLLLADDKAEEKCSVLEARDIMSMKLCAQMAVLSACETAQGQQSGGDGLVGLAWAFRAAGCPSIVASQWEVNDEATGQLMFAFYKALKAGKRKDEALRQAMLSVRKQKPAPFYWAAFQVMGDTRPVKIGKQN